MRVAFIFPGQGAQAVGMGKEFYDTSPEAKSIFDKADKIIGGLNDIIFNGPQEKLTETAYCQPAIFTFSIAAFEALKAHKQFNALEPAFACGLSLGEYSALTASGALGFEDTLKLVQKRCFYMDHACKITNGGMAAIIGLEQDIIEEVCQNTGAEVANFNSPEQIVITGDKDKVQEASKMLEHQGAKRVMPLDVAGAFHSSLMQDAADKFMEELDGIQLADAAFPIVHNVDGQAITSSSEIKQRLSCQITSSVQWIATIEHIVAQGVTTFFEVGPGTILKGLLRKINRNLTVHSIQKPEDIDRVNFS